jgi:hypothetical protein
MLMCLHTSLGGQSSFPGRPRSPHGGMSPHEFTSCSSVDALLPRAQTRNDANPRTGIARCMHDESISLPYQLLKCTSPLRSIPTSLPPNSYTFHDQFPSLHISTLPIPEQYITQTEQQLQCLSYQAPIRHVCMTSLARSRPKSLI